MERQQLLVSLIIIVFAILAILVVASEFGLINNNANYEVNVDELANTLTIDNSNWRYDEETTFTISLELYTVQILQQQIMSL